MRLRSALLVAILLATPSAHAVRPFITDDARVVGKHQAQLETWIRRDRGSTQHWVVPAFGPTAAIEVALGGLHGSSENPQPAHYALGAPLLQAKLLAHAAVTDGLPGVAFIGGTFLPFGFGGFEAPPSGFLYMALTEALHGDAYLFHANLGVTGARIEERDNVRQSVIRRDRFRVTWGLATQLHIVSVMHLAAEVFSGDPYAEVSGGAGQAGFRFVLSDHVQLDSAIGSGLWGEPRISLWGSLGVRLVTSPLF